MGSARLSAPARPRAASCLAGLKAGGSFAPIERRSALNDARHAKVAEANRGEPHGGWAGCGLQRHGRRVHDAYAT